MLVTVKLLILQNKWLERLSGQLLKSIVEISKYFHSHFQPALPKEIDFDEDVDYEDEEEFMDHGHSLMDELELHLTSQDEMNKIVQEK